MSLSFKAGITGFPPELVYLKEFIELKTENDKNHEEDIYVSPIYAEPEELKGLPPALIITNENDVLRDEGEEYGRKLTEAGVNVMNVRINGTIHDSMMLNGLSETPPVKAAFYLTCKTLKKALHNE